MSVALKKARMKKMAEVVRDAGGELIGRTRLQKVVYFLTVTGLEDDFRFSYKHYGPYSEQLADAAERAVWYGKVSEQEMQSKWGGMYSIYRVDDTAPGPCSEKQHSRRRIVSEAARKDPIVLELAATAVFLSKEEGYDDPWSEVKRRKPMKYDTARRRSALALLKKLKAIEVPEPLPDNVIA